MVIFFRWICLSFQFKGPTWFNVRNSLQRLAILEPIMMDYKALTFSFKWVSRPLMLRSWQTPRMEPIKLYQLQHLMQVDSIVAFFQLFSLEAAQPQPRPTSVLDIPCQIQTVLDQFAYMSVTPTTLPPPRTGDHQICLQSNVKLVQVCPYHYPNFQKGELECMVHEMLGSGFIWHNCILFSFQFYQLKKRTDP